MTPLGERLRTARAAKGLSLRGLGKKIDRAFETIGSVERGERKPSKELLRRLCTALDLDLAEMMPLSGRLPPEMIRFLCEQPDVRRLVGEALDSTPKDLVRRIQHWSKPLPPEANQDAWVHAALGLLPADMVSSAYKEKP